MSRRLRASIRANNKGRTLRPKTSQPRSSAPSLPPAEAERISSEPNEAESLAEASEKHEAAETSVAPATTASAVAASAAEPAVKPAAPSPAVKANAEPPKAAAAPEAPKDVTPSSTSRVPAPAEAFKAEAKPAQPEPKPAEPAAARAELSVVEEPVVSERAVASERASGVESASSAGKGEGPASKRREAKGVESSRPSSKRFTDEEIDSSSISAEFFRRDEDSLPPVIDSHHEAEDAAHVPAPLSPAAIARRARLRRVVAGVVAFAGVISLAVVGKTLAASKEPAAPVKLPVVVQQEIKQEREVKAPPPPVAPKAVEEPKPANEVAKVEIDPRAAEKAEAKPEAKPEAEELKKVAPSADAETLKKETLSLLNRGKNKDAIVKAREAIAADPADATSYLYLGSALQDSGKWKDGVEAYCDCVRNATKGPVNECRQMGGHK